MQYDSPSVKYIVFNNLQGTYGLNAQDFGSGPGEADVLPLNYSRQTIGSKATGKACLTQYRKNTGRWQFLAVVRRTGIRC